ncbi:MAG: hypothetical protein P4L95_04425, partial [Rouxiella aceris]|nr:hypothetical protein [Rouxiella aceris]
IGVFSAVLQVAALWTTADLKNKKTLTADQSEAHAKFWAGVVGLTSASLSIVETGIKQFNLFASASSRFRVIRSAGFQKWIFGIGGKALGVAAGVVAVAFDGYHAFDESSKGHVGLAIAYGLSAAAGTWLTFVVWVPTLPIIGSIIAVILLIGTAIYLAFNVRDKIQKWLVQCLWRRIPVNKNQTEKLQVLYKGREEAELPIWPNMAMEMSELNLALGTGE